jgi:hypothetical protein
MIFTKVAISFYLLVSKKRNKEKKEKTKFLNRLFYFME